MLPCPATTRRAFPITTVLAAALVLVVAIPRAGGQPPTAPKAVPDALGRFRQADPAARKALLDTLSNSERLYQKVDRGNVTLTLVERGVLEPAQFSDVVCKLKASAKNAPAASTIKRVIEEGTLVNKGDLLLELDDSAIREQVEDQQIVVTKAEGGVTQAEFACRIVEAKNAGSVDANLGLLDVVKAEQDRLARDEAKQLRVLEIRVKQAEGSVERAKRQAADKKPLADLDLQYAEGELEIAQIMLKQGRDQVEVQKRDVANRLRQAQRSLEVTKLQGRANLQQAEADVTVKKSILEASKAKLADLKEQMARCKLTAPHAGLVSYFVPERTRFGAPTIAVGESVREGQTLLRVSELNKMQAVLRIHEALIGRVSVNQPVELRVDAFPNQLLTGRIASIANVASATDFFAADVKLFPTVVSLDGDNKGGRLKPGMSGEASVVLDVRVKVVRVPSTAVLRDKGQAYCFVKNGAEIREQRVTAGLDDGRFVEIKSGLEGGDEVLASPRAAIRRLPSPARGLIPGFKGQRPNDLREAIFVRNVKPPEETGSLRPARYGLTREDCQRLAQLPDVERLVPVRRLSREWWLARRHDFATVVATTKDFADLYLLSLAEGRFLTEEDERDHNKVIVLGALVAVKLFPDGDPLWQKVRIGSDYFTVVGVLQEQYEVFDEALYVCFSANRAYFGDITTLHRASGFRREQVYVDEAVVVARAPNRIAAAADAIADLLETTHHRKDWEVRPVSQDPEEK